MLTCVLLVYTAWLISNLDGYHAKCINGEFCQYRGVVGYSTSMIEFERHQGLVQRSCPFLCLKDPLCTAVTFDLDGNLCRLHLEQGDGHDESCISLRKTPGTSLWVVKRLNVCPNVRIITSCLKGGTRALFRLKNKHLAQY